MKNCKVCDKELLKIYKYYDSVNRKHNKLSYLPKVYCSKKCHDIGQKTGISMKKGVCENCNTEFMRVNSTWNKFRFCSQRCHRIWQKLENHPNWKGDKTSEVVRIRSSLKYREWAKTIKKRDNYTCQICGVIGGRLRSNHIKRFCDYPELRFELHNGITICRNCDFRWVWMKEKDWESYFNFNLIVRKII